MRVGRKVIRDRVLDDAKQLFRAAHGTDAEFVQQLNHQAGKALKRPWNPNVRVDLDQDALGGVDVDLKQPRLVERRVEQRQEALVSDVRTSFGDVAAHLCEYALVIIAVEQSVLVPAIFVPATGAG